MRAQLQVLLPFPSPSCCVYVGISALCLPPPAGGAAAPLCRSTGPAPGRARPPHLEAIQQLFQDRFPALLLHFHSQANGLETAYGLQGLLFELRRHKQTA